MFVYTHICCYIFQFWSTWQNFAELIWMLRHWQPPQSHSLHFPTVSNTNGVLELTCEAGRTVKWKSPRIIPGNTWHKRLELYLRSYSCWICRSQWPHGLRRRSAAARLLRLWVRIPSEGLDICLLWVVCCKVQVSAMSWSLVQRGPTDGGASLCVI